MVSGSFRRQGRIGESLGDRIYGGVVYCIVLLVVILLMYPVVYILSCSLSDAGAVLRHEVVLWPVGFNVSSYGLVFQHPDIPRGFLNSVIYAVLGTGWSMLLTILGSYALSRKYLPGRNVVMFFIAFTMFFSGGLIPTYLVVSQLKLLNTVAAMVFPAAVSTFNLILLRTFFSQVPDSMEESAVLDGANDFLVLVRIFLPLSIPALSTVALLYFVGKWNDFFTPSIYFSQKSLYPLQVVLRQLLIEATDRSLGRDMTTSGAGQFAEITPFGFKSAIIIISILPLSIVYPFLQRYFIQGIMIGAVKG